MGNLRDRAKKLKTDVPAVFLALKDKRTPWYAKITAGIVVIYALSPALIALTVKLIPKETFAECRESAEGMWSDGKPKKWYYAIPFILIWAAVIALIVIAI